MCDNNLKLLLKLLSIVKQIIVFYFFSKKIHSKIKIIDEEGEDGFKAIENRVNASIDTENTVIATGGSVVYCSEAMEHLKSIGKVVYLSLSLESLEKRLGNLKKRGVLLKEGQTLKSLYEERVPLYEKYADIVVDEEGKDLEASLQALLETLQTGVIK